MGKTIGRKRQEEPLVSTFWWFLESHLVKDFGFVHCIGTPIGPKNSAVWKKAITEDAGCQILFGFLFFSSTDSWCWIFVGVYNLGHPVLLLLQCTVVVKTSARWHNQSTLIRPFLQGNYKVGCICENCINDESRHNFAVSEQETRVTHQSTKQPPNGANIWANCPLEAHSFRRQQKKSDCEIVTQLNNILTPSADSTNRGRSIIAAMIFPSRSIQIKK